MCVLWKKENTGTMKLNRPVSMVDTDHAGFHVSGWKSLIDRHSLQTQSTFQHWHSALSAPTHAWIDYVKVLYPTQQTICPSPKLKYKRHIPMGCRLSPKIICIVLFELNALMAPYKHVLKTRQLQISDFAHAVQSHHPCLPAPKNFLNIICACLAYRMIPSAVSSATNIIDDWMIPFAANATATAAAKIANAFQWLRQPPKLPFPVGDVNSHPTHGSLGPPESSSKMASLLVQPFLHSKESNYFTMVTIFSSKNCPVPLWDRVPI